MTWVLCQRIPCTSRLSHHRLGPSSCEIWWAPSNLRMKSRLHAALSKSARFGSMPVSCASSEFCSSSARLCSMLGTVGLLFKVHGILGDNARGTSKAPMIPRLSCSVKPIPPRTILAELGGVHGSELAAPLP